MTAWKFLIVDMDGNASGTDNREQAEQYAKEDSLVVIDCDAKALLDEDGEAAEDVTEANTIDVDSAEDEGEDD
tara:strand:+ start:852 stop:1070 length:219 start_codon:yes stop_codon:yes gene_type:complete